MEYIVDVAGCGSSGTVVLFLEKVVTVLSDPGIPTNNPSFNGECPNDILLVLDESSSIIGEGYESDVEAGVNAFLDAISGTGSRVGIIEFSNTASEITDNGFFFC